MAKHTTKGIEDMQPKDFDLTTLWGCYTLLAMLRDQGIIQRDLHRQDNILVYVVAVSGQSPGVWYSQNIFEAAEELLHDAEGKQQLLRELEEI